MGGNSRDIMAGLAFVKLAIDDAELNSGLKKAQTSIQRFAGAASKWMTQVSMSLVVMRETFGEALNVFSRFDTEMRSVQAVTSASAKEIRGLTDEARRLGRTTTYTSEQVATLMKTLGRMGFSSDEIKDVTDDVMALAKATGTELNNAAQIAGSTMRTFGKTSKDLASIADVFTASVNNSAQNLDEFAEAVGHSGATFAMAGYSIEDMSASIGVMANMGIRGSKAGTALATAIRKLASSKVRDMLAAQGVAVTDLKGDMLPIQNILANLARTMDKMPKAGRISFLEKIFGARGMLAGSSLTVDVGAIDKLLNAIEHSGGVAKEQQKKIEGGVTGSVERWRSALEDVKIQMGEIMATSMISWLERLTKIINSVSGAFVKMASLNGVLAEFLVPVLAIGTALKAIQLGSGIIGNVFQPITALNKGINTGIGNLFGVKSPEQSMMDVQKRQEVGEAGRKYYSDIYRQTAAEYQQRYAQVGFDESKSNLDAKKDELARLEDEKRSLEAERKEYQKKYDTANDGIIKLTERRKKLRSPEAIQKNDNARSAKIIEASNAKGKLLEVDSRIDSLNWQIKGAKEEVASLDSGFKTARGNLNAAKKELEEANSSVANSGRVYSSFKPGEINPGTASGFQRVLPFQRRYQDEVAKLESSTDYQSAKSKLQSSVSSEIDAVMKERVEKQALLNTELKKEGAANEENLLKLNESISQLDEKLAKLQAIKEASGVAPKDAAKTDVNAMKGAAIGFNPRLQNDVERYAQSIHGVVNARQELSDATEKNLTDDEKIAANIASRNNLLGITGVKEKELQEQILKVKTSHLAAAFAAKDAAKAGTTGAIKVTAAHRILAMRLKANVILARALGTAMKWMVRNWLFTIPMLIGGIKKLIAYFHNKAANEIQSEANRIKSSMEDVEKAIAEAPSRNERDKRNIASLLEKMRENAKLSGDEIKHFAPIVDDLNKRWNGLNITMDKTTGHITLAADALSRVSILMEQQAQQRENELKRERREYNRKLKEKALGEMMHNVMGIRWGVKSDKEGRYVNEDNYVKYGGILTALGYKLDKDFKVENYGDTGGAAVYPIYRMNNTHIYDKLDELSIETINGLRSNLKSALSQVDVPEKIKEVLGEYLKEVESEISKREAAVSKTSASIKPMVMSEDEFVKTLESLEKADRSLMRAGMTKIQGTVAQLSDSYEETAKQIDNLRSYLDVQMDVARDAVENARRNGDSDALRQANLLLRRYAEDLAKIDRMQRRIESRGVSENMVALSMEAQENASQENRLKTIAGMENWRKENELMDVGLMQRLEAIMIDAKKNMDAAFLGGDPDASVSARKEYQAARNAYLNEFDRQQSLKRAYAEAGNIPKKIIEEQRKRNVQDSRNRVIGRMEQQGDYVGAFEMLKSLLSNNASAWELASSEFRQVIREANWLGVYNGTASSNVTSQYTEKINELKAAMEESAAKDAELKERMLEIRESMFNSQDSQSIGSFSADALSRALGGGGYQQKIYDKTAETVAVLNEIKTERNKTNTKLNDIHRKIMAGGMM